MDETFVALLLGEIPLFASVACFSLLGIAVSVQKMAWHNAFDEALHKSTMDNNVEAITKLLNCGFDINARDFEGRTPLHIAASHGNKAALKLLLQRGAEVNAVDNTRRTAIMKVDRDQMELRELLLQHGAIDSEMYYETKQPNQEVEKNEVTPSEVASPELLRRIFIVFLVPFVVLLFYNGLLFALQFSAFSIAFYFVALSWFLTEITVKPPWYHHKPGATSLTMKGLPDYYMYVNNPLHNLKIPYEDVTFPSSDGYTLSGWYVPANPKAKKRSISVVLVHGTGRDRRTWLRILPMFHNEGYDCLMFDFREHGLSSGASRGFTYGIKERHDVIYAVKYIRSRAAAQKVAAIGTSVGGSACIMAASLDPSIDVIIAENPVLTCAQLQDKIMKELFGGYFRGTILSRAVFNLFRYLCRSFLNMRVGNKPSKHCQAAHVVDKVSPRPLLLMHGTYDDIVPPFHSERLFELAKEPKELWMAPGAVHCNIYNIHPEEFKRRVLGFLEKYA